MRAIEIIDSMQFVGFRLGGQCRLGVVTARVVAGADGAWIAGLIAFMNYVVRISVDGLAADLTSDMSRLLSTEPLAWRPRFAPRID